MNRPTSYGQFVTFMLVQLPKLHLPKPFTDVGGGRHAKAEIRKTPPA
ncbi:hypothetical protein [Methylobacterium indicum]|nr:hypothetical protein [Methylobacterium indicum]